MKNGMHTEEAFFAAANGYYGFRSNFDSVFSPLSLERLYVIKGGPGTGKSTLMKAIANQFCGKASVTRIFCSSDPNSLDGVLIERDGVTVGIADGTAPHAIEPRYPGASEVIINLGDGFDVFGLRKHRDEISELSNKKGRAYKRAYKALGVAGHVHGYICDNFLDNNVYNEAENMILDVVPITSIEEKCRARSDFLISSFSKDGLRYLPFCNGTKRVFKTSGDGISEYVIMHQIAHRLAPLEVIKRVYYSPLSRNMIDAIETESDLYTVTQYDDADIDSSSLLSGNARYEKMKLVYDELLTEARDSFAEASEHHFGLENIYSQNICFDNNENIRKRIIGEIREVFDK